MFMSLPVIRLLLLSLVIGLVTPHPGYAQAEREPAGSLAAALKPFVDQEMLAGAVLVVTDKDKVLAEETVGFADRQNRVSMKADSFFWIASMSKPITATAMMILVDEGRVSISDPVEKYIPEFGKMWVIAESADDRMVLTRPKTKITIEHLLSHTSGLPFSTGIEGPARDILPLTLTTRDYATVPLLSEPGTRYLYSNCGINTAGRIVEIVSGMPIEKFLQTRVFNPLEMRDTTFFPTPAQLTRLAKAYRPAGKSGGLVETTAVQLHYPLDSMQRHAMPGGGLFSTAGDCGSFCRMLLNGGESNGVRIVSTAAIDEMARRHTAEGIKENYGLGWKIGDLGTGSFGHGGAFATNMTIDRQHGLAYVLMVQHGGFVEGAGGKILSAFHQAARKRFVRE